MKFGDLAALSQWRAAMHSIAIDSLNHKRFKRAALVGVASALLAACNGGPGGSSSSSLSDQSSSDATTSSVASSSSVPTPSSTSSSSSAPALSAQMMFNESCAGCHGSFSDGVTDGNPAIDVNNLGYDNKPDLNYEETEAGLAAYIENEMVAKFCAQDAVCDADALAAWLWSMRTGGNQIEETAFSDFVTNVNDQTVIDQGKMLYEQTCLGSGCHDSQVTGIGWAKYKAPSDFHKVIEPTMPKTPDRNPAECVGECSALISAYLWSVRPIEAACTDEDGILFAKRSLPLLTPSEYKNSIRDLFAFISPNAVVPEDYLNAPSAIYVGSFPHTLGAQVSEDGSGKRLFDNAVAIADWNAMPTNGYVRCSFNNVQQCADEFINGFAEMAFRRPLKTEPEEGASVSEVAYFQRIFTEAPSIEAGIKWAIVGALNAPQFIYRDELGIPVSEARGNPLFTAGGAQQTTEGQLTLAEQLDLLEGDAGAYVLTPYQYASVLSYMITGSTPDQALMNAAESGDLNTRTGVEREIERLFGTARAERHMKDFVANWMQTQELFKNTPLAELDSNVDLRELMLTELQEFFWHIVRNEDVPFSDFYNADYTFLNQRLAEHYGVVWSGGNSNDFVKTMLSSGNRGGITTMGAFLAGHAHGEGSAPILRGVHVREDLLCHHIVPPGEIDEPEGLRDQKQTAADEAAANGTLTTRRYFEIATSSPPEAPLTSCGQCHYYDINPVGGTMADFDGFGRYRTEQVPEGGNPSDPLIAIDALSGSSFEDPSEGLRGIEDFQNYDEVTAPINGGRELALTLGQTQAVQSCMVEKAFRSVLSRPITTAAIDLINRDTDSALNDYEGVSFACAKEALESEFQASGQSVKTLFKELGNLSLLRFRRQ